MSEEAGRERLIREGLDLLWQSFNKVKEEESNNRIAQGYLEKTEAALKTAEDFLAEGKMRDSIEIARYAGNLLSTINFRCAIALLREANAVQEGLFKKRVVSNEEAKKFFVEAHILLGQAEVLLDNDKIEEARDLLMLYHKKKVVAGLTGPKIF